ncbi:unnamed protein product [Pedinophyceae sp. YPF-701]|nr:unnamed protein product [Pedinophyceae sp. YPF-701]
MQGYGGYGMGGMGRQDYRRDGRPMHPGPPPRGYPPPGAHGRGPMGGPHEWDPRAGQGPPPPRDMGPPYRGPPRGGPMDRADGHAPVRSANLTPYEQRVASGELQILEGTSHKPLCVSWSCDGKRVAAGCQDGAVVVWSLSSKGRSPRKEVTFRLSQTAEAVRWHPSQPEIVATAGREAAVSLWDARTGKRGERHESAGGNVVLAWHPSGDQIACANEANEVFAVDVRTMREVARATSRLADINAMSYTPDGQMLVHNSRTGVQLRSPQDMQLARAIPTNTYAIFDIAISADGRSLATAGADGCVAVVDLDSMCCTNTISFSSGAVQGLGFSGDGNRVGYVSTDPEAVVADVRTGDKVASCPLGTSSPLAAAYHPKLDIVAIAGADAAPAAMPDRRGAPQRRARAVGLYTVKHEDRPTG